MKKLLLVSIVLSSFMLNSCDILDQAQQALAFTKCEFRLGTLTNTQLAGVNIHNMNSYRDLNAMDIARVGAAYATGSLPLSFTLNVDIKNPNAKAASMSKLDWILLIDGVERLTGVTEDRISVPANGGTATMPMNLKFDLMKVVEAKNLESLANFAMNLAGVGNRPSRVTLKAKPTVYVGTNAISYPNYITIENEFSSN